MCQKNTKTIFMETPNINLRLRNFFILSTPLQFLSSQGKKKKGLAHSLEA